MSRPSRTLIEAATAQETEATFLFSLTVSPNPDDAAAAFEPIYLVNNTVSITRFDRESTVTSFDYATTAPAGGSYRWNATNASLSEETLIKRQGRNSLKVTASNTGADDNSVFLDTGSVTLAPGNFVGTGKTLTFLLRPERAGSLSASDGVRVSLLNGIDTSSTDYATKTFGTDAGLEVGKWNTVSAAVSTFTDAGSFSDALINRLMFDTNRVSKTSGDVCYADAFYLGTSRTYLPFPFTVELPPQVGDTEPKARLVADAVDQILLDKMLTFTHPPIVTLSVILAKETDVVEAGPFEFLWQNLTFEKLTISGDLEIRHVLNEPFPAYVFDPQNHAGLFR